MYFFFCFDYSFAELYDSLCLCVQKMENLVWSETNWTTAAKIPSKLKNFGFASHIEFYTLQNREANITEFEFLLEFKAKPMGDVHIVPPI